MNTERKPADVLAYFPSEAAIERITNAVLARMADVSTRAEVVGSYTPADIAAAVIAAPDSDVARFLAGVIAQSIELVAALDYADIARVSGGAK